MRELFYSTNGVKSTIVKKRARMFHNKWLADAISEVSSEESEEVVKN